MFFRKLLSSKQFSSRLSALESKKLRGSPRFIEGVIAGEMVRWDEKVREVSVATDTRQYDVLVVCPKNVERDGAVFGLTKTVDGNDDEIVRVDIGPFKGFGVDCTGPNGLKRSVLVVSVNTQENAEIAVALNSLWGAVTSELTVLLGIAGGDQNTVDYCNVCLVDTAYSGGSGVRKASGKFDAKLKPESVSGDMKRIYADTESYFEKPKKLKDLKDILRAAHTESEYEGPKTDELELSLGNLKIKLGAVEAGNSVDKSGEISDRLSYDITANIVDMESRGFILAAKGHANCKDYAIVRGVSDFADPAKGPKFQFLASVACGVVLKSLIEVAYLTQDERRF